MTDSKSQVKGFFLYFDQCEPLEDLTDEQCGQLLKAMVAKFQGHDFEFTDSTVKFAFKCFEVAFKRDAEKYINKCDKMRANVNKRLQKQTVDNKCEQLISIDNKSTQQPEPEPEIKPEENNNIIFISDQKSQTTTKRFIPPLPEDVDAYCQEKGYAINGQSFCDYYEARGWMLGKVKMKNWKAAVSTWVRNEHSATSVSKPYYNSAYAPSDLADKVGW